MYGRKHVSKEEILSSITDYDIFRHYCTNFSTVNTKFSSEFRKDSNPSCIIGRYGQKLYYKDFAEPDSYDVIAYVMRKFTINYIQALNMISRDFQLDLSPTCSLRNLPINMNGNHCGRVHNVDIMQFSVAPTVIKIKRRKWTVRDGKYWKDRYGITQRTLQKYRVIPVERYWMSGKKGHAMFPVSFHCYGYFCGYAEDGREAWKIYQPFKKGIGKWMSNVPGKYLQGEDQLPWTGDLLIITKSLKDVMVLHQAGYHAVAPHGENFNVPEDVMARLRRRFTRIILLYDNDDAGIKASNSFIMKNPDIKSVILPTREAKDVSDYVEYKGYPALKEVLRRMLEDE